MKWLFIAVIVAGLAALLWANAPRRALAEGVRADRVRVLKSARRLELYRGGDLLASYAVSLGPQPVGHKQREGDGRTPEGQYLLDYAKLDSSSHRALHISYPAAADRAAAAAAGVDPGGLIMIHGMLNHFGWIGRLHRAVDWTNGCVAVTNDEMDEIMRVVPVGTPIEIRP